MSNRSGDELKEIIAARVKRLHLITSAYETMLEENVGKDIDSVYLTNFAIGLKEGIAISMDNAGVFSEDDFRKEITKTLDTVNDIMLSDITLTENKH